MLVYSFRIATSLRVCMFINYKITSAQILGITNLLKDAFKEVQVVSRIGRTVYSSLQTSSLNTCQDYTTTTITSSTISTSSTSFTSSTTSTVAV